MTENMIREIIKAFAYGHDANSIASIMDISVEEVEKIKTEKSADIEATKKYYSEMEE